VFKYEVFIRHLSRKVELEIICLFLEFIGLRYLIYKNENMDIMIAYLMGKQVK
jgi:hypothetical protein